MPMKPKKKKAARTAVTKKSSGKKAARKKHASASKRTPTLKTKTKAKAKAKAKASPKKKKATPKPRVRRDATGHLDPAYAKDLRRLSRENAVVDDDRAFLVGERADDALAQELGTEFVETVTSGEDEGVELRDAAVEEETGGPFVTTTDETEFAGEPDESNPVGATREPFPKT